MFEKEAKEYANKWLEHVQDLALQHKSDDKAEYIRILEAYQKGAEFGYNFVKRRKTDEWHYVKDGDLPNNKRNVWCYYGDDYGKGYYDKDKNLWLIEGHIYCSSIIAWKEIVLPKKVNKCKK